MVTNNSGVILLYGQSYSAFEQLKASADFNANAIYFIENERRFFVGDKEYSRPLLYGEGEPAAELISKNPIDILYFDITNSALYASTNGSAWKKVVDNAGTQAINNAIAALKTELEGKIRAAQNAGDKGIADAAGALAAANAANSAAGTAQSTANDALSQAGINQSDIATLKSQITGLTGAMHFLGTTTTELTDGVTASADVTIGDKTVTAVSGDVVIAGKSEYVYNGTVWSLFGDTSDFLLATRATELFNQADTKAQEYANTAEQNAKNYADSLATGTGLKWGTF